MDSAFINPKNYTEYTSILEPIVEEYRSLDVITCRRGDCYSDNDGFIVLLMEAYPEVFEYLQEQGLRLQRGEFLIDTPANLPLDTMDLHDEERDAFLALHDDYDYNYDEQELSDMIWDYALNNINDLGSFYAMDHWWIDIDGLIIDFALPQFENAIDNLDNLEDRYSR